jgi:hypothetical protein
MKFILSVILIMLSTITQVFAQQCLSKNNGSTSSLITLAQSSLSSTCFLQRDQYKCSELESNLDGDDKKKIIQCDAKSIEENKLTNMSFRDCIISGLKISGENLLDLAKIPGKISEAVVKGFHDTQLCNSSIDKKRELLTAFNLSISDSRFKLSEQFLGHWLEDASCAEVDKLLFARYQNFQDVSMRERRSAIDTGKKVLPLAGTNKDNESDIIKMLKSAMEGAQVRYECYTPRVKAEMICAGITSLIVDAAMGMGVKSAISKITAVVKSKKALGVINRAVAAEEKIDLKDSSKLLAAERKKAAALVLEKQLSEAQQKAIIEAHEIGLKEGRGYFNYTSDDLRKKSKILKEAGFSEEERALLMRSGITGQFSAEEAKKAVAASLEKEMKYGNPRERQAILGKLNSTLEDFKKSKEPAVQANYARLLGEMAQGHDIKAAKGFYQMGLDKVKTLADKDPGFFNRTKTLENYLDLASHAGDQAAVKKGMSGYVKQQFASEAKRNGWKNTAEAANDLFERLETDVQHYKSLGSKGASNLESARRKQKSLLEEFKYIDQTGRRAKTVDSDYMQFATSE